MTRSASIPKIKVLLGDRDPIYREGLGMILQKSKKFDVIDYVENGEELISIVKEKPIDVMVTDVDLSTMNGIEVTEKIRSFNQSTKIICLSGVKDEDSVVDMMEAGANGYLIKSTSKDELFTAINQVMVGRVYYCDYTGHSLSRMLATSKKMTRQMEDLARFSKKELEIIHLICQEHASKNIAAITHLAHRTVEKYRERIMEKTGASNMVGIVKYAIRNDMFRL